MNSREDNKKKVTGIIKLNGGVPFVAFVVQWVILVARGQRWDKYLSPPQINIGRKKKRKKKTVVRKCKVYLSKSVEFDRFRHRDGAHGREKLLKSALPRYIPGRGLF